MATASRSIVAIDGPAGAGKSTVARRLAERLGYRFLDTGALYRAVTLKALRAGADLSDEEELSRLAEEARIELRAAGDRGTVLLDGQDVTETVRKDDVSRAVPKVAAFPRVRAAMVPKQREFARTGRVVAEGRDMGTVVFPDAGVKFYLDAKPAVRASRRAAERGDTDVEKVEAELARRDHTDSTRAAAPLRRSEDAVYVDTSSLSIDEAVDLLEREVRAASH
jgi:cytidylate kinase